jgi:hypothetical protein
MEIEALVFFPMVSLYERMLPQGFEPMLRVVGWYF